MARWAKNVNAAKSVQQQQLHAIIEQERDEVVPVPVAAPDIRLSEIKRTGVALTSALQLVGVCWWVVCVCICPFNSLCVCVHACVCVYEHLEWRHALPKLTLSGDT